MVGKQVGGDVGYPECDPRALTLRRVGARGRRRDAAGLGRVRGMSWSWNPALGVQLGHLRARFLTDEEIKDRRARVHEGGLKVDRLQFQQEDFLTHA